MPAPPDDPKLDFSKITFPSDRITFRQIRARNPEVSVLHELETVPAKDIEAVCNHRWEVMLVEKAFASTLGRADPHPEMDREELIEALNDTYPEYGLSSGLHQTKLLVKELERAAISQAVNAKNRR